MTEYNELITGLKQESFKVDYDSMFTKLRVKEQRRTLQRGGAVVGIIAVLLVGVSFYLAYPTDLANEELMVVFGITEQQDISDGPIVNYIFSE